MDGVGRVVAEPHRIIVGWGSPGSQAWKMQFILDKYVTYWLHPSRHGWRNGKIQLAASMQQSVSTSRTTLTWAERRTRHDTIRHNKTQNAMKRSAVQCKYLQCKIFHHPSIHPSIPYSFRSLPTCLPPSIDHDENGYFARQLLLL